MYFLFLFLFVRPKNKSSCHVIFKCRFIVSTDESHVSGAVTEPVHLVRHNATFVFTCDFSGCELVCVTLVHISFVVNVQAKPKFSFENYRIFLKKRWSAMFLHSPHLKGRKNHTHTHTTCQLQRILMIL